MKNQLSDNIRKLRREKNMTQEKLAEVLGVSLSAVSKWETGAAAPDIDMLPVIAEYFDTSIDLLMSYEYHKKSIDSYTKQIKQLCEEKRFNECTEVTEQAVKCYPNNFEISYLGAQVYFLKGAKLHNSTALSRSISLYNRALELSSQNDDPAISDWTIQNDIAQVFICMGNIDDALQILRQNNAAGFNDYAIGHTLSCIARKGEEAKPYLARALLSALMQIDRVCVAYTNVFEQAGEYSKILETMDDLIAIYDIFRIPGKVSYIDKLMAKLYASEAMVNKFIGNTEESEIKLRIAYRFAELYDSNPQDNFRNIRYCEDGPDLITMYDDFGETAYEGIIKTMNERRPDTEATRLIFGKLYRKSSEESEKKNENHGH